MRNVGVRRIVVAFWILALGLAAVQAWKSRFEMAPDGIQYLDNAGAYLRGDWHNAANTQWSPMYAWLLAAGLRILRPSPYWEFPVLHAVNFCIFVVVVAAFQFFLSTLIGRARMQPAWMIAGIACTAFLYAMLDFTNVINPTPDLTMAIFVFLAAGLLLRIATGDRVVWTFVAFGATLGLGYIAKAPFFVYSFLCFAILLALLFRERGGMVRIIAAVVMFAATAGPYIAFLSYSKGRFTYGDSGRFNVAWMVNGLPYYNWQGGPAGSGTPLHPTRKLSNDPPVYEFATPIAGTYPPWYDPIYWNEGAKVRYNPADFARAVIRNARVYLWFFHHRQIPLICGLAILVLWIEKRRLLVQEARRYWPILLFAVFPFLMYAPVHVDQRFLGAFFVLLWTGLFAVAIAAVRKTAPIRILQTTVGVVAALMLVEALLVSIPTPTLSGLQTKIPGERVAHPQWEIAKALLDRGVQPGDRGALLAHDHDFPYAWARLARVQIVAEALPREMSYDRQARSEISRQWEHAREILKTTPATFVVSPAIPGIVDQPGWERLAATESFVYKLR